MGHQKRENTCSEIAAGVLLSLTGLQMEFTLVRQKWYDGHSRLQETREHGGITMDMDAVRIRCFEQDDRERVKAFFDQMGGETRAFFDRNSGNSSNALNFFEGKDQEVIRWMALYQGRMVGYLFLWDLDKLIPWLGIAVAEDCKGMHLGRRLMQTARDYAMSQGKGGILLTTHLANLRGQGLYERSGYERMGIHTSGEILYLLRFER